MKLVVLFSILALPSFAQKIYFNSYDTDSRTYALCIYNDGIIEEKAEGFFLGKNWMIFESNPYGFTSSSIQEYRLDDSGFNPKTIYETNNFIQDFGVTWKSIFTIEASDEKSLYSDSKCFQIDRKSKKKVALKVLNDRNLYAVYPSPFSNSLILIEKNENNVVVGIYDEKKRRYGAIRVFDFSSDLSMDLNIHNKILWISSSKIAMLLKSRISGEFQIYERDFATGSEYTIPIKADKLMDFDFFEGKYFLLTKDSFVESIDGKIKFKLINDNKLRVVSGFKMSRE